MKFHSSERGLHRWQPAGGLVLVGDAVPLMAGVTGSKAAQRQQVGGFVVAPTPTG